MRDLIHRPESADEITSAMQRLRALMGDGALSVDFILDSFERWSSALDAPELRNVAGVTFLRLWLRRNTLEPILTRELGRHYIDDSWQVDGRASLRAFPVGVVGHWAAGNIDIQPILSMTCALLGGNSCIVRVPSALRESTELILEKLQEADRTGSLSGRVFAMTFDHSRSDLHEAMARGVDGAMVWGGEQAVSYVRALPFPHWARVLVFGPRLSVAMMDAAAWREEPIWFQRLARDVWQFEQQACSSPQTLFIERSEKCEMAELADGLEWAFREENRLHQRRDIEPAMTSAICQGRASWLLANEVNGARFPQTPDWTILLGSQVELPTPTQGRTLHVLVVDDLFEPISRFHGNVQTVGLGISVPHREQALAEAAARRGVDRVVKLGQMHVFGSPWDGLDLVRPMVRLVRHVPSSDSKTERRNGTCAVVS